MNSSQIAESAIAASAQAGRFLSIDLRMKLAIAEVALIVYQMDESTPAPIKVFRLEEAIFEIQQTLEN